MAPSSLTADERLVTRRRAADLLGVSVTTIDRWVTAGELRAIRRRGYIRIYRESIADFEDRHQAAPARPLLSLELATRQVTARPELVTRSASAMVANNRATEKGSAA